jgi:hypothetical protein
MQNKKLKKNIFLLVILISISLFGCTGNNHPIQEVKIYTGSQGITLDIEKDSLPEYAIENQTFSVGFTIENKGAYSIDSGYLALITEDDYLDINGWSQVMPITSKLATFELEGKSHANPIGEKKTIFINMQAKELSSMTETHTVFLGMSICYPYKTYFSTDVCIDEDFLNQKNQAKPCTIQDIHSSSQGAPVAIKSIKTNIFSNSDGSISPRFTVTIQNIDKGKIIHPSKIQDACTSSSIKNTDFNQVTITLAKLSTMDLECSPTTLKLIDNSATTICTPKDNFLNAGTYSTLLEIEFEYGYMTTTSKELEIRKISK